jgi:hypothetical protein
MKTLPAIASPFYYIPRLTVPPVRKLIAEWQSGPETLSGCAQRKLRLSFASSAALRGAPLVSNNSHEHDIHSGNGNGHLPLWWVRR